MREIVIPQETLRRLYWKQNVSAPKIARIFKVDVSTITNKLRKYSIPVKSHSESMKGKPSPNKGKKCPWHACMHRRRAIMREICIISAHRAESGLLQPVMKELLKRQAIGDVHPTWYEFSCEQKPSAILEAWESFVETQVKPDIVLCPTDRFEMIFIAAYCFNHGIILGHFHAGNMGSCHPDEMNRRAISCFSHILFCNTEGDKQNLVKLGEEAWRCHVVGSTALDNVSLDESLCPKDSYDLVLLHPDPISIEATYNDLKETVQAIKLRSNQTVIWLRPNKDKNCEIINLFLNEVAYSSELLPYLKELKIYDNLPRTQFLGLLKNCSRYISNSSSLLYEAPYFRIGTVNIGLRNRDRPPLTEVELGGAARIAEILATIQIDDKLRRKKLVLNRS